MSAIAGILYFGGAPVEPGLIEKLTRAMSRRGPDEQTHWVQGSLALGHCMLRTTPESLQEHQPLMSQDKSLVLVWDGRLDNREELRRDLLSAGVIPRDNSDAELALQSYAAWGETSPKHLLGDFAFAVWDTRQSRLFCARDHMGARPFYYTHNDRFFAFASEDEVLTRLPGVSSQPNEERIAYFLVPGFADFDYAHSWLEAVRELMPARTMTLSPDGASQIETYWQLQPGNEARYASDEACRDAFLEVFGEAVRCRMRTLGNVSAMMSGGLDSAGIAAMVKRLLPEMPGKAFHTYSAISDHPETCVESQCIQSLTRDLGDTAHFVAVPSFTGMVSVEDLIETAWSNPHPVDNSILLPAMMCLAASRDGQRVMLHGASGDLATHAPHRYAAYFLRDRQWQKAWQECREASRNHTYLRGNAPGLLFLKALWHAYVPGPIAGFMQSWRHRVLRRHLQASMINRQFARKLKLKPRMHAQHAKAWSARWDNIRLEQIDTLQPYGIVRGLDGYERVAGRFGVELRDPWADKRVVEFFVSLPLDCKVRDGWTKHLVRSAFFHELDRSVRYRIGKEHLGWHFTARLMRSSPEAVAQTMEQDLPFLDTYVDRQALRTRYRSHLAAKDERDAEQIYDTMTLALWLKHLASKMRPATSRAN